MKNIRVASSRIRRDCAICALSETNASEIRESRLWFMLRTEQNDCCRKRCDYCGITALLHDSIDDRDCEATEDSREGAHSDIRNVVLGITVPDVFKLEVSIESGKPASESEKKFGKRRMYVEIIFSKYII